MGKRGRPRHPDILTPREWDVLALLRDGLSNPEIAERLDVSRDTVKTHVSDILGKLGVSTREDAASWRREEHRPWWAAMPVVGGGLARVVGAALAVAALAGTGVLVWGLTRTSDEVQPYKGAVAAPDGLILQREYRNATFRSVSALCGDGATAERYGVPRALQLNETALGPPRTSVLGLEAEPYGYEAKDVYIANDMIVAPDGWELSTRAGDVSLLASLNRFSTGEVFLRRLDQPDALFRYNAGYCDESGAPRETPEPGLPGGGVPYTLPNDTPRVIEHVDGNYLSLGDALDQTHEARSENDVLVAELGARTDLTLLDSVEWNVASGDEKKVMWFFLVRIQLGPTRPGEEFGLFAAVDAENAYGTYTSCCRRLLQSVDSNALPSP